MALPSKYIPSCRLFDHPTVGVAPLCPQKSREPFPWIFATGWAMMQERATFLGSQGVLFVGTCQADSSRIMMQASRGPQAYLLYSTGGSPNLGGNGQSEFLA